MSLLGSRLARILAGAVLLPLCACADPPTSTTKFYPIRDLQQSGFGPEVLGGKEADTAQWQASFYSLEPVACSSNLVGPRALLLAAHCVTDGAPMSLVFQSGRIVTGKCKQSPGYLNDASEDYAVCLLNEEILGIQYEMVNTDAALLQLNQPLIIGGFGCTQDTGAGGNDGIYRIGIVKIRSLPNPQSPSPNFLETEQGLCLGDSGGGAFIGGVQRVSRTLVGVNAQGDRRTTSLIAVTSTVAAKRFLLEWSKQNKVTVCGVTPGAKSCP